MYRQSPSRNQRSKGIRIKHVLQICLLLAVCFWLIYQVKHSHDKKKEFDESDAKTLLDRSSSDGFIKLGRKDIHPRLDEAISKNPKHDDPTDQEDDTTGEEDVEENRHEEDEPEDNKIEAKEEGKGVGDDETDEHEQENSDGEVDREEDVIDEEEKTGDDENEIQETDPEDGQNGEIEKENSMDGDDGNNHEAREEQYKADDASSAVTHDTQTENANEHPENNLEEEKKESDGGENEGKNRRDLEGAIDGQQSNATTTSETKVDMLEDNSEKGSSPSKTVITDGSNDYLPSNSSFEVTIENRELGNVTESEVIEGTNNSTINVDSNNLESNSTGSAESKDGELESHSQEFSNSSNNSTNITESYASENVTELEASVEAGNSTKSSLENSNEIQGEKSDSTDGTDEIFESTMVDKPEEEVQHDTIDISDTSNSMEETNVRTDLDTLPQIQTEGTENEDVAAE